MTSSEPLGEGNESAELPLRQDPLGESPSAQAHLKHFGGSNPVIGWARAIALGIRDTAEDMVEEGRRGAAKAREEGWQRFDAKTKYRRRR